jgi:hypothetical protein
MISLEQWLYWTQIACIAMSVVLAGFMGYRYLLKRSTTILVWAFAWFVVALRVAAGLFFPFSFTRDFINDFLTISHDLLWLLGLAILLEMGRLGRIYFPLLYLTMHSIINALLYFGLGSRVYGAVETTIFAHPIILFILFWYFHVCAGITGHIGARIISISFLLWALDYIILGVPYFGMGITIAGAIGWTIGLIFRVTIFVGFLMMATREYKRQEEK